MKFKTKHPVKKFKIKCYKCFKLAIGIKNQIPLCEDHYPKRQKEPRRISNVDIFKDFIG